MLKNGRPAIIAGVDRSRAAVEGDRERGARVAWHGERGRQAVARTGRHDAERRGGVEQCRADFVQRAVASPGDHQCRSPAAAPPPPSRARARRAR